MYGYTRQWDEGHHKWLQKLKKLPGQPLTLPTDHILMATLIACDLKTDVQYETWKVEQQGKILKHFNIMQTVSWEVENNLMVVHSEDEVPFTLVFISAAEAQKADFRLYMIVNGALVIDCNDHLQYRCTKPANLQLLFL